MPITARMMWQRRKLKRKPDKNPDILKTLGERKKGQFLVGFAAETQNLIDNAKEKVTKKNLDMIVANDMLRKNF